MEYPTAINNGCIWSISWHNSTRSSVSSFSESSPLASVLHGHRPSACLNIHLRQKCPRNRNLVMLNQHQGQFWVHRNTRFSLSIHDLDKVSKISNNVIMSAVASQITSLTIVYSTDYSGADKKAKLRVTGLCEGNSLVTGEFPAQRASNAQNVSIWWRHHGPDNIIQNGQREITTLRVLPLKNYKHTSNDSVTNHWCFGAKVPGH